MSYQSSITLLLHHAVSPTRLNVKVQIIQAGQVLNVEEIDLRHRTSRLHLDFNLHNTSDPIKLQIKSSNPNINEFPVYVDRIVLDDLADIPFFVHRGKILGIEEVSNCLYRSGVLEYNFLLPLIENSGIAKNPTADILYKDVK